MSVAANAESTSSEGEGTETEYRLDPSVGDHSGVKSPLRRVRTRLYFTTESQLHALLNALRFSPRSIAQKVGCFARMTLCSSALVCNFRPYSQR